MTPPSAPYVCAVCGAPVVAGARFCAQCGTSFSERPPLRVATPPAEAPVARPVVPIAPPPRYPPPGYPPPAYPPPSYGPPPSAAPVYVPPERNTTALWIGIVVIVFVAALVGAYLLFAEPVDRDETDAEVFTRDEAPGARPSVPPPVSADESLDEGAFPTEDEIEALPEADEPLVEEPLDEPLPEPEAPEPEAPPEPEAEEPRAEARPSPRMAAAWSAYQSVLGAYQQAVRAAGTSDKGRAEIAAACSRLYDAGNAVLSLPGREQYAGQITRDRRGC